MKKKTKNKLKITLLIILLIIAIGITITNGVFLVKNQEIEENLKNLGIKPNYYLDIEKHDNSNCNDKTKCLPVLKVKNLKSLNYDSSISAKEFDSTETSISLKELEKSLEIRVLKSDNLKPKKVAILRLEKNNNKVGSAHFYIRDAFLITSKNKKKPKINITMQFNTKYTQMYKEGFSIYLGTNDIITTKYINNLDTYAYFSYSKKDLKDNEIVSQLIASFVYDDIAYTFEGSNISREIMLEVLESLK